MSSSSPSSPGVRTHAVDDVIEMAVPLRAEHAATLRVVATSLCADANFSVDEIDDVKLGVSELFTSMLDAPAVTEAQRAHVRFAIADGSITVTMNHGDTSDRIELDTMATAILSSIADHYSSDPTGLSFTKRASETAR